MFLRKYKYLVVVAFMSIFVAKMGISGAPVFFKMIDISVVNAAIMQVELEHDHSSDASKKIAKFTDFKLIISYSPTLSWQFLAGNNNLNNSFIKNFKRYLDPFHPAVPTPPPNFI